MNRLGRIQLGVYPSALDPPPNRRAGNLALIILCAVAALSFAVGLTR